MEIAETEVIHHFIRKHLLEGHREPCEPEHLQQQKPSFGQLSERLKLQERALPTPDGQLCCCVHGASLFGFTHVHQLITAAGTQRLLIKP